MQRFRFPENRAKQAELKSACIHAGACIVPVMALAALVASAGCKNETSPRTRGENPGTANVRTAPVQFAGSEKCADCHAAQHSTWLRSHHANAMARLDAAPDVGPENANALARIGESASPSFSIGYIPLRQYLAATGGGRRQVLPYARATAAPDGETNELDWFRVEDDAARESAWLGRRFNANRLCIECHTTGYRKGYDAVTGDYDTNWVELGVGCESCHGPSAAHAAAAKSGEPLRVPSSNPLPARNAAAWIFLEGAPTARREPFRAPSPGVDTCARCHSLRDPIVAESRAGMPFLAQFVPAVLDANNYELDGQIKAESYEYGAFLQSKMYAAGVGCNDCHEPHGAELREQGNALCATCHRTDVFDTDAHRRHDKGRPGSNCVDCHMPERVFMRVDGRRDHGFKIPRPHLTIAFGVPNACNGCHADRSPEWAAAALDATPRPVDDARTALARALYAAGNGASDAHVLLTALGTDAAAPAITRASALAALARLGEPVPGSFLARTIGDSSPLVRVYAARLLTLAPAAAQPAAWRILIDDPTAAVRHSAALPLAASAALSNARPAGLDTVLREYVESLVPSFDDPAANVNAALAYTYRDDTGAAETRYLHALKLEPGDTTALVNLADLYRMTGKDGAAVELLSSAAEIAPGNAATHYALGLALQRAGSGTGALEAVGRAATLAPQRPEYPYAYALALQSAGRTPEALSVLEENARRHPHHWPSLRASASMYRDTGDTDAARNIANAMLARNPQDAFARALLQALDAPAEERPNAGSR